MSFIYARKYNNRIRVYADRKITVNPDDESILIKSIGKEQFQCIKKFGIIKNVIINKKFCICSAGILEDFNKLLEYIDINKDYDYDKICNKALEINIQQLNRTDFIICYIDEGICKLMEIKDNNKREVTSSWIGSKECFNIFQSLRLGDYGSQQTYLDEFGNELPLEEEYIDSLAFGETLKKNNDESVGEESVSCVTEDNKFCYLCKIETSTSKPRTIIAGTALSLYDTAADGGYTSYVYDSSDNYKMYINQMKSGIVYCPHITYKKYSHLRMPKIEHCTAEEFEKKYNCGDRQLKLIVDGKEVK